MRFQPPSASIKSSVQMRFQPPSASIKFSIWHPKDAIAQPIAQTGPTKFIHPRRQIQHNVYGLPQCPNRSHALH
ncbi:MULTISPECIES: hypothetical protein [unclassified Microcoleus]|uniref:hypothetical protein n=1 Tax=unclassified Microcoleus TaxID=2642155 RepID=UPI0025D88B1C|nr:MULTISPECIES: hypothetical protein [unclassified Microcoleus]